MVVLALLSSDCGSSAWALSIPGICFDTEETYTLRDINQNGMRELALVHVGGGAPMYIKTLNVLRWSGNDLRHFGTLDVWSRVPHAQSETTVYVRSGTVPSVVGVRVSEEGLRIEGRSVERTVSLEELQQPSRSLCRSYDIRRLW